MFIYLNLHRYLELLLIKIALKKTEDYSIFSNTYLFIWVLLLNLCIVGVSPLAAQNASNRNIKITGKILDNQKEAVRLANIQVTPLNYKTQSNEKGEFEIIVRNSQYEAFKNEPISIQVSFVGKKTQNEVYTWEELRKPLLITLQDNSLTLSEILINPTSKKTDNSISSITFSEEAIEKVQAFSLMDVLNTLPGKQTVAPNINAPQTLTLRSNMGGVHDLNNSLGIPIIIDGIRMSNDANMQARPVAQRGMGGAALPAVTSGFTADVPFQGFDLRAIPVEAIESIEVIQGVASAEYSEMTDGAIIIERKAGKSPWHFTTNINNASSNYSLNKGFNLPKKWGGVTFDLNYAESNSDPRDKTQEYRRYGASLRWNTPQNKFFRNRLSLDYDSKIDEAKLDPDDGSERQYFSKQNNFRISNNLHLFINQPYLRDIQINVSYSQGDQNSYSQWLINQPMKGYSVKDTTGIYEGIVLNGQYLAVEQIVGAPITAQGRIKFSSPFSIGNSNHHLSYGVDMSYNNNGGKGIISDPDRPRFINLNNQNVRPYSFEMTPSFVNGGLHISDKIQYSLFGINWNSNLGVRLDYQSGSYSVQPRLQTQVVLNKNWNLGAAYGISSKSPTLLQKYPIPTWLDIPLILAYNTKSSLYLVYTEKFTPENKDLKPIRSNQAEITLNYRNDNFSSYINAYYKGSRDGFNSIREYELFTLPNYDYYFDPLTEEMVYYENGTFTDYHDKSYYVIKNLVGSNTYGVDWSFNIHNIEALKTQINFSTSFIQSEEINEYDEIVSLTTPVNHNNYNVWYAIFEPNSNMKSYRLTSKLGTTTHIPKLGFVVSTNTDIFWMNHRSSKYKNLYQDAIGYLDANMNRVYFQNDSEIFLPARNLTSSRLNQQMIYANFSLSVAKEIGKKIRIAVTAYNAFNLRPQYTYTDPDTQVETTTIYNSPISITGGISIRF